MEKVLHNDTLTHMNSHYGEIVERTIRRNGYSISELARTLNVNRRTIYNWFLQRNLKSEIIYRIGCAVRHDFSVEFPHLFTSDDFRDPHNSIKRDSRASAESDTEAGSQGGSHWKNKYISLLEQYNNMLLSQVNRTDPSLLEDVR